MLCWGKHGDDSLNRLRRGRAVNRGKHLVTGVGGLQCHPQGFHVAQLADQDYVGILTQRLTHGLREGRRIAPTSSWAIIDFLLACTYSTGSSMVMILFRSVLLIKSIIVARVVLLPLPVVPVNSVSPRSDR